MPQGGGRWGSRARAHGSSGSRRKRRGGSLADRARVAAGGRPRVRRRSRQHSKGQQHDVEQHPVGELRT
eukprot:6017472-Pyramimonas_sp.AAC.1